MYGKYERFKYIKFKRDNIENKQSPLFILTVTGAPGNISNLHMWNKHN